MSGYAVLEEGVCVGGEVDRGEEGDYLRVGRLGSGRRLGSVAVDGDFGRGWTEGFYRL